MNDVISDLDAIKARYNAAFDTFHEIQRLNAQSVIAGKKPSASDLEREAEALAKLEIVRRELLAAL